MYLYFNLRGEGRGVKGGGRGGREGRGGHNIWLMNVAMVGVDPDVRNWGGGHGGWGGSPYILLPMLTVTGYFFAWKNGGGGLTLSPLRLGLLMSTSKKCATLPQHRHSQCSRN